MPIRRICRCCTTRATSCWPWAPTCSAWKPTITARRSSACCRPLAARNGWSPTPRPPPGRLAEDIYRDITVGKSIGTLAAAHLAASQAHLAGANFIWLTPHLPRRAPALGHQARAGSVGFLWPAGATRSTTPRPWPNSGGRAGAKPGHRRRRPQPGGPRRPAGVAAGPHAGGAGGAELPGYRHSLVHRSADSWRCQTCPDEPPSRGTRHNQYRETVTRHSASPPLHAGGRTEEAQRYQERLDRAAPGRAPFHCVTVRWRGRPALQVGLDSLAKHSAVISPGALRRAP